MNKKASSERGAEISGKLPTEPYKGTRDFYPEDMAIQRYIFDTWAHVAELFGYERYDASVLEPAELYRAKSSEEIVNEQTYTFTDRGDREVTLRPEMTPTVARMVAARRRELTFPLRWYSIPNLFRYERPQKGRVREHWQLNCDIFLTRDDAEKVYPLLTAETEIILLAYSIIKAFGASEDDFLIKVGSRNSLESELVKRKIPTEYHKDIVQLIDKKGKIDERERLSKLAELGGDFEISESDDVKWVRESLNKLGVNNVVFDPNIVRGFEYYTGVVFEIFDTSSENNRSLVGGGSYYNLTGLFDDESIPGAGFGMGDVTMRDFLETHGLLTAGITAPTVMVIPTDSALNLAGERIAQSFRNAGISTAVDLSTKKIGKRISAAGEAFVTYALVLGEDEIKKGEYVLKNLADGSEQSGTIESLLATLS